MSEPTVEEQLAIVTNSRNALMMSNEQLFKEKQKTLADHTKALADQATKNQEAITKLEQDHATVLATKATELASVQSNLATKTSQLEAVTQAKTTLEAQVETLNREKQELKDMYDDCMATVREQDAANDKLQAKIEDLEVKIIELTPPPKPESVTPAQIRIWLISNGISLDTVAQMIAAIPDASTRDAARVRWEYGLIVLRDDPLVQQMGTALGFTTEQMDAAFLAASQID